MKTLTAIALLFVLAGSASGVQRGGIRATVTFVTAEVVYISPGSDAGIRDSSRAYLLVGRDTVAVLTVIATSSKSAACTVVRGKRRPSVGDVLLVVVPGASQTPAPERPAVAASDTVSQLSATPRAPKEPAFFRLQGRVNLRYLTVLTSGSPQSTMTQPGVSVNIRGMFREQPLQFTLLGNFRSLVLGSSSPFQAASTNQTRIHRLSIDYDDGTNVVSVGRVNSSVIPSAGYVDGAVISRRLGDAIVGGAAGYEPSFTQRAISSDYKKFALFAGYQPDRGSAYSVNAAYARTFFQSDIDREALSAWANLFPSRELYLYAQGDVDLRMKSGDELVRKARLTNLFANVNYRFADFFTLGLGVAAFRPSYSFAAIRSLADSLFDTQLRTTPTVSMNWYFSPGITLYNTFSPRTSEEGFGKEYSNYSSLGYSNLFGKGMSVRASMNLNKSLQTNVRGYSASLQGNIAGRAETTLRYQYNEFSFVNAGGKRITRSVALDVMAPVSRSLSFWGSVERLIGLDLNTTTVSLDLSWLF